MSVNPINPSQLYSPPHPQNITAVILAGGLARRMGGVAKGLQVLQGQALVAHVAARLAPQVQEVWINANVAQAEYAALGYRVIADQLPPDMDVPAFAGPLAGLATALQLAPTPWVLTVPCDCPFPPLDLVARLAAGVVRHQATLAIAYTGEKAHPVFSLCATSLVDNLLNYLQQGQRRVLGWCMQQACANVDFGANHPAFVNLNTLEELDKIQGSSLG